MSQSGNDPTRKYPVKLTQTGWAAFNQHGTTRALFTDAALQMRCPRCGAEPGFECVTPTGRAARTRHGERCRALMESLTDAEFNARYARPVHTFADVLAATFPRLSGSAGDRLEGDKSE